MGLIIFGLFALFLVACVLVKSRFEEMEAKRDTQDLIIASMHKVLHHLMEEDIDAANVRLSLQRLIQDNEGNLDLLAEGHYTADDLAFLSSVCAARTGHNFECIDVDMLNEEPIYTFSCTDCGLAYSMVDSGLNKKEVRLAAKYVDTFKPSKTK